MITNNREPKLHILHSCDNPSRVNPKHLREGTDADNVQDMMERGRYAKGQQRCKHALATEVVIRIKEMLAKGDSNRRIASETGVNHARVYEIKKGVTYKWVEISGQQR